MIIVAASAKLRDRVPSFNVLHWTKIRTLIGYERPESLNKDYSQNVSKK